MSVCRVIVDTRVGRRFRVKAAGPLRGAIGCCESVLRVKRGMLAGHTLALTLRFDDGCRATFSSAELSALALSTRSEGSVLAESRATARLSRGGLLQQRSSGDPS